jgi:hypothetical protein
MLAALLGIGAGVLAESFRLGGQPEVATVEGDA